jgi:predicted type IV restriction endonuclease
MMMMMTMVVVTENSRFLQYIKITRNYSARVTYATPRTTKTALLARTEIMSRPLPITSENAWKFHSYFYTSDYKKDHSKNVICSQKARAKFSTTRSKHWTK